MHISIIRQERAWTTQESSILLLIGHLPNSGDSSGRSRAEIAVVVDRAALGSCRHTGPIKFHLSDLRPTDGNCRQLCTDDVIMSIPGRQFYNEDGSVFFSFFPLKKQQQQQQQHQQKHKSNKQGKVTVGKRSLFSPCISPFLKRNLISWPPQPRRQ